LVSRKCGSLDATISLATEGPLHGQAHSLGRTEGPLHGQAHSPGRTEGPLLGQAHTPTLCTVATLRKRSFYYIGYQKEKSRTPPFKWTKMFGNQAFSARFTKGSGCGLVSRNCGSLDATISLATVKKWALFFPTSSMRGWLSESVELS
jgi:hypothetical protein